MRSRVRNEPDSGPEAEGAVVTYSRLSTRGRRDVDERRTTEERQEPVLEARQVPYEADLRAFDPERAGDDVAKPKRGRNRKRRGGFAAVLLGTLALAVGMVILAYAYGIATRVDGPSAASASAPAPASQDAGSVRAILPADDAARSVAAPGTVPAADAPAETAQPPAATDQASREPASTPVPEGADGTPMDGDFAMPAGDGAQPAAQTAKPSQPATGEAASPPATEAAKPAPSKAASAPPADSKPATASQPAAAASKPAADKPATAASAGNPPDDSTDSLITNIEKLLQNDGATAEGAGQPSGNGGSGPMPLASGQSTAIADPNAVPQLPDPTATSAQRNNRLIPPADIPNVSPTDSGSGLQ